jgi:hypothetical protein
MARLESLRARYGAPPIHHLPFLLVHEGDGAVLVAPFAKRRAGLSPDEADRVKTVAGRLRGLPPGRLGRVDRR